MIGRLVAGLAVAVAIAVMAPPVGAADGRGVELGPRVTMAPTPAPDAFPATHRVVDRLDDATVLRVHVAGFGWHTRGLAMQCVTTTVTACRNELPVQFDDGGNAFFQYLVTDDFAPAAETNGRCRDGRARCTLVVRSGDDEAVIDTVFGDRASARGAISVSPSSNLADGDVVTVTVRNYPPGARVRAVLCRAPHSLGSTHCGTPGPSAPMVIAEDGTGTAALVIRQARVGTTGAACDRRTTCGVSVVADDVFARAPVARIDFAGDPGPDYDTARLGSGLGIAALLLGLAFFWMATGEWGPPQEAAATALDDAEYADLDALVAEQERREREAGVSPDDG